MKFKVLQTELEYDFLDADALEFIEDECDKAVEEQERVSSTSEFNNARASEQVRSLCRVYHIFFDTVFGEGTSKKVFGGKYNFSDCLHALDDVIRAKREGSGEELKRINDELTYRYSGQKENRSQRRNRRKRNR